MKDIRTHRDQIQAAVRDYGHLKREQLPDWLRNPTSSYEFNLSVAVYFATTPGYEMVRPDYDATGFLVGWLGLALSKGVKR